MNKNRKPLRNLPFIILLIALTFIVLFRDNSLGSILEFIKEADLRFIVAGTLLSFAFIACEGLNTYTLLNFLGSKSHYFNGVKYSIVGFFYSAITPSSTGGQPMQMVYMKKDGVPLSMSSIVMIIELISYQAVTFVLAAGAFIFKFDFIRDKIAFIIPFLIFGAVINICMIVFFAVVLLSEPLAIRIVNGILRLLHKLRIIKNLEQAEEKAEKQIDQYKEGITLLKKNPFLLIKVFFTTLIQLTAQYSVVFAVYKSFGQSHVPYFDVLSLQALFNISMCALPLPGAIGISEGGFLRVFKFIFPKNLITPAMLVTRGLSFYLLLIITGITLVFIHIIRSFKEEKKIQKGIVYE